MLVINVASNSSIIMTPVFVHQSGLSIDFLFPFGTSVGDNILQASEDGVANLLLTAVFPYFDHAENDIYVSLKLTCST